MKKGIGILALLAMVLGVAQAATTVDMKLLGTLEQAAHLGANCMIEVEYSDFSTTATNTAEELTLDIEAGQGFTLLYAVVQTEFVGLLGTDSLTVIVGDDADDNQFLVSLEMATESTELVGKFGTTKADGVFYESADTIDFLFTPNAENATSGYTAGKVVFYCFIANLIP